MNQLIEIVSLTNKEFRRLGVFLRSRYFNKYKTIIKLYAYLKKAFPKINTRYVSLKQISIAVYGEEKANKDKVRKLVSDFNLLFQKFILWETVSVDNAENNLMLLYALRKKMLYRIFKSRLAKMKLMKKKEFGIDDKYYMNKMNYFNELFMSAFSENSKMSRQYSLKKFTYLNYYFIYQSLVYYYNNYSEGINESNYTGPHGDLVNFIFRLIEKHIGHFSSGYPDIITLYYANKMFVTGSFLYYDRLLKYFNKNRNKFDYNLQTAFYIVSENFLKLKMRDDPHPETRKRLFEVRREILSSRHFEMFFSEGRRISSGIFFQIFDDAVNLKEFEWADKFTAETKNFIPHQDKEDLLNTVTMILKFFKGDINIYDHINNTKKKNTRQFIYSRLIKMMLLYKTNALKPLYFETEAFKKYLIRKQKTKTEALTLIKKSATFTQCMRKLLNFKLKSENAKREDFLKFETKFYKGKVSPVYAFWFDDMMSDIEKGIGVRKKISNYEL